MQIRMEWRSVTFDWNRARAFLVTAEEGSLSAAARALGLAQPTLGRQVTALEQELGVALFERAGRGLMLTPAGMELVDHVRAMGEAATRVSLTASGQSQSVEGLVVLTASEVYAAHVLPPIVRRIRHDHPGIELEIVASNAVSDLRRREADIALRNARPTDPDLIARRLRDDAAGLYATPECLARFGHPQTAEDLSRCDFVGFDSIDQLLDGLNAMGLSLTRRNFPVTTASHLVQWAMAREGVGIGVFPTAMAEADAAVTRVLPSLTIPFPVWLTAHRALNTSRRVRLVFDLMAEVLG
ncbi:MAG: LysR family transcriptional regulator [Paracoccaceae bacterium]